MKSLNIEATTTHAIAGNLVEQQERTTIYLSIWSTAATSLTQNGVKWVMPVTELEYMTGHGVKAIVGDVVDLESEDGGKVTITCTPEGIQATNANSKLKASIKKNALKEFKNIAPIRSDNYKKPAWWK